jgi:hypothetical protein
MVERILSSKIDDWMDAAQHSLLLPFVISLYY